MTRPAAVGSVRIASTRKVLRVYNSKSNTTARSMSVQKVKNPGPNCPAV